MATWLTCVWIDHLSLPTYGKSHLHSSTHAIRVHRILSCRTRHLIVLVQSGDQRWIHHSYGCEEELYEWYKEDVGARRQEITLRCANEWLILNWQFIAILNMLNFFPVLLLFRQVHQKIRLPVCGWREVKLGFHFCWHLHRFSVKRAERETDMQTEWIGRGGQRERQWERRVKERHKIYLTMWVCEVSRHAS